MGILKGKKIIFIFFLFGMLFFQIFNMQPSLVAAGSSEGCRKCHSDVTAVHHTLIKTQGMECLDCHVMIWDEDCQCYVLAEFRDCFACHDYIRHRHNYSGSRR